MAIGTLRTWLPLCGKLISRDGSGYADPADPICIPELWGKPGLYIRSINALEEIIITHVLWDWDNKQVLSDIEGPQEFIDWLEIMFGLRKKNGEQLSISERQSIYDATGHTEMIQTESRVIEIS